MCVSGTAEVRKNNRNIYILAEMIQFSSLTFTLNKAISLYFLSEVQFKPLITPFAFLFLCSLFPWVTSAGCKTGNIHVGAVFEIPHNLLVLKLSKGRLFIHKPVRNQNETLKIKLAN